MLFFIWIVVISANNCGVYPPTAFFSDYQYGMRLIANYDSNTKNSTVIACGIPNPVIFGFVPGYIIFLIPSSLNTVYTLSESGDIYVIESTKKSIYLQNIKGSKYFHLGKSAGPGNINTLHVMTDKDIVTIVVRN